MYADGSDAILSNAEARLSAPRPPLSRARAAAEVFLCSGFPSQLLITAALAAVGLGPTAESLSPTFLFLLTGLDTVILLALIVALLRASGDQPAAVFVGGRPIIAEALLGITLVPATFLFVVCTQLALRTVAPDLHNVEVSPFQSLFDSPELLAGFVLLVLIGGGVREELQRAFLLHRFEQRLGGARVGLLVTSLGFGLGHTLQGWDAAIITGVLGAFWGALYLSRRSAVAPVVCHALFNVAQIAVGYAAARAGQLT